MTFIIVNNESEGRILEKADDVEEKPELAGHIAKEEDIEEYFKKEVIEAAEHSWEFKDNFGLLDVTLANNDSEYRE